MLFTAVKVSEIYLQCLILFILVGCALQYGDHVFDPL